MKGKILLCNIVFFITVSSKAQVTLFSQNFNTSTIVTDYIGNIGTKPNNFDNIAVNNGATMLINAEGRLVFEKKGATGAVGFNRNTVLSSSNPGFVRFSMDFELIASANDLSQAAILGIGSGINNIVQPPALNNTNINQYFYINITTSGNFTLTAGTTTSGEFSGLQNLVWFINKTGNSKNYPSPDGKTSTLAHNQADIWVGTTKVITGIPFNATAENTDLQNFRFSLNTGAYNSTMAIDNINIADLTSILPVSLTYFEGKATDEGVNLKWKTTSEQNNSHFNILRSADGVNFVNIGKVKGNGNSSDIKNYSFNDNNPLKGKNYYQLQQVDYNGDSKTHETINVSVHIEHEKLHIYANQTSVNMSINMLSVQPVEVEIFDVNGHSIIKKKLQLSTGDNQINLPTTLSPGIYIAKISGNNLLINKKFAL